MLSDYSGGRAGVTPPHYTYWSAEAFGAYGTTISDLLNRTGDRGRMIDEELRVLRHPFDGIEGVARFFVGEPRSFEFGRGASFQIFAPYEAALVPEMCGIKDGQLNVTVRAGSEDLTPYLELGVFAWRASGLPLSTTLSLASDAWVTKDGGFRLTMKHEIGPYHGAVLLLRAGERCLFRLVVGDRGGTLTNPRQVAYSVFDPGLQRLNEMLEAVRPSRSDRFERAVPRLFHFLGFAVDLLAVEGKIVGSADALAFADVWETCLVVECTVESINAGGKLGRLTARTRGVASALHGWRVTGVLATALERSKISRAEYEAAGRDGLVVLAKDDLLELWIMARNRAPLPEVLGYLASRVPPIGDLELQRPEE